MMRKIFLSMTVFLCFLSGNAYSKALATEEDEVNNGMEMEIDTEIPTQLEKTVSDSDTNSTETAEKVKHLERHRKRKRYSSSEGNGRGWSGKLIKSIIEVESRGNQRARNHGCCGELQISRTAIRDANEYLRKKGSRKRFDFSDRFNREKSVEVFNIEQERYNKEHSLEKAIRIWNGGPRGSRRDTDRYLKKVLREYRK